MEVTDQEREQITEALFRAEESTRAADDAVTAQDDRHAVPLLFEALAMTLEALAMCARKGALDPLANLLPSAVYFVKAIQHIESGDMEGVRFIRLGSSIGVDETPQPTVVVGADGGLRRERMKLTDGNLMELCFNPRTGLYLTMATCKHCNSTFSSDWDKSVAHSTMEALISLAGHGTRCAVRQ